MIGLGADGAAAVAAVSTVNFALRSPAEQDALTGAYGRWLNSLTGPVQVVIRAGRADLSAAVTALREAAPALPHPALEHAALEHASFLAGLAEERDVLTRQVLLVIREPSHGTARPGGGTAAARAAQRAGETARLLAAADLQVSVLDGGQVTALLAACADPAAPAHRRPARRPRPAGHQPGQARVKAAGCCAALPRRRPCRARRTCPARRMWKSPPGTCASAGTTPPPWPSPATRPRSARAGWSR